LSLASINHGFRSSISFFQVRAVPHRSSLKFSTQKITHQQQLPLDQQYHRQFKLDDASIKNKVARNGLDCLVIFLEITSRRYLFGIEK
jgi:hypothetical protein